MNLAAPYFSSPCPTPKTHEFSLEARQNAGPHEETYHQLACKGNKQLHPSERQSTSGSAGRGAKLAFDWVAKLLNARRGLVGRVKMCAIFVAMHFVA
jgi:hypothetical protein